MTSLTRRTLSLGLLAMGSTAITGCTPRPSLVHAQIAPQPNTRSVLVATNRTATPDPTLQFVDGRSDDLSFLRYDISVPPNRTLGSYAFPQKNIDPDREFFVSNTQHYAIPPHFVTSVNTELRKAPDDSGNLLLFVHGFNVSHSGAVFRAAQIATDFGLDAPMMLFSWPSAARVSRYAYDRDSVLFARKALADTLATLAQSQTRKITILAHSMGGFLAMEALKRLSLEGDAKTLTRVEGVILAQPDIDVDVFRSQMTDIDLQKHFVVVLASGRDRALKLSTVLTGGHPRVGTGGDIEDLRHRGVFVVDVSDVGSRDFLRHDTYASSPALLKMIRSGRLSERIIAGAPGQDLLIEGVRLTGEAALAIAHLPYAVSGL